MQRYRKMHNKALLVIYCTAILLCNFFWYITYKNPYRHIQRHLVICKNSNICIVASFQQHLDWQNLFATTTDYYTLQLLQPQLWIGLESSLVYPYNPITTTVNAVSDPGLTSIHWILYYHFLHYLALSTLHSKVQTKLLLGRTPTLLNSCCTRNNYTPWRLYGRFPPLLPLFPFCKFYIFFATWNFFILTIVILFIRKQ